MSRYKFYIPVGNTWKELRLDGFIGDDGKSAYEIAVENGFVGSEADWLLSLQAQVSEEGIIAALGFKPGKITVKTVDEWNHSIGYIPDKGELCVYSDYESKDVGGEAVPIPRIKIGSGNGFIQDLAFVGELETELLLEHVNNDSIHVTPEDKRFWNNKINITDSEEVIDECLMLNRN